MHFIGTGAVEPFAAYHPQGPGWPRKLRGFCTDAGVECRAPPPHYWDDLYDLQSLISQIDEPSRAEPAALPLCFPRSTVSQVVIHRGGRKQAINPFSLNVLSSPSLSRRVSTNRPRHFLFSPQLLATPRYAMPPRLTPPSPHPGLPRGQGAVALGGARVSWKVLRT